MTPPVLIGSDRQPGNITDLALRSNCRACKALCCILPSFDSDQGFGYDKESCTPCRNLTPELRCSIHAKLKPEGYTGCVAYECFGAGQRTTRMLALPDQWYLQQASFQPVYDLFSRLFTLHQLRAMLALAIDRTFDEGIQSSLCRQAALMDALDDDAVAGLDNQALQLLKEQVDVLLSQLRIQQGT